MYIYEFGCKSMHSFIEKGILFGFIIAKDYERAHNRAGHF